MESATIGKLAEALAKAQAAMDSAKKDSINPHFKSKYADLAAVIDAVRQPLGFNGLSYVQYVDKSDGTLCLITKLMHISGEWISGSLPLLMSKNDMQGFGASLTYARRYSLSAMVGIAQDDDDGNTATAKLDTRPPVAAVKPDWKFLMEVDQQMLRDLMNAYAGGKETVNRWVKHNGPIQEITYAQYNSLSMQLAQEAQIAKGDPASFENA